MNLHKIRTSTVFLLILATLAATVPLPSHALSPEYAGDYLRINLGKTPVINHDPSGNLIVAWQDIRPYLNGEIILAKLDKEGTPRWSQNRAIAAPKGELTYLSLDTDSLGNIFVAWQDTDTSRNQSFISVQKFSPDGLPIWKQPVRAGAASDARANTMILKVSELRVDNKGNSYLAWTREEKNSGAIELFYQVINSAGYPVWPEGQKQRRDTGMYLMRDFGPDLELNKNDSLAYVTWMETSRIDNNRYKTINIQKYNYNGVAQWRSPHHIYLADGATVTDFLGLEMDINENLSVAYLTTHPSLPSQVSIQFQRVNRLGQLLWEDRTILGVAPERLLVAPDFAVDSESRLFVLINSKDALMMRAYQPDGSGRTSVYGEIYGTVVRKEIPAEGTARIAQAARGGLDRSNGHLSIVWNEADAQFYPNADRSKLLLSGTSNDHIYLNIAMGNQSLLRERVQVDTPTALDVTPSRAVGGSPESIDIPGYGTGTSTDTDRDGLSDILEVGVYHTNPSSRDSDGDGYLDGEEVSHGYDPLGICKFRRYSPSSGTYAYGSPRLADIKDEECRSWYLDAQLSRSLSRSEFEYAVKNWNFLLKAFVYGGYPVSSITSWVQGRSEAIHATTPWRP